MRPTNHLASYNTSTALQTYKTNGLVTSFNKDMMMMMNDDEFVHQLPKTLQCT